MNKKLFLLVGLLIITLSLAQEDIIMGGALLRSSADGEEAPPEDYVIDTTLPFAENFEPDGEDTTVQEPEEAPEEP